MSDQNESIYASIPFKFVVDGKSLYIHADLVSLHSKPLDCMMNGSWAEAQESCATLEDVDESTFVRFIEWAHKGCYTAAKHKDMEVSLASKNEGPDAIVPPVPVNFDIRSILVAEPTPEPPPEPEIPEQTGTDWSRDWGQSLESLRKVKKGKKIVQNVRDIKKGELKEAYMSRKYTVRPDVPSSPSPRHNMNPGEDYTDVFLSHARLYVFAAKWLIQPLRVLALEELHATLAAYTLYPERTGDIVDLLRYFYPDTGEPREGLEDMRALMMQYVGYELETLIECEDFKRLIIENGGELLSDFMTTVRRRIS